MNALRYSAPLVVVGLLVSACSGETNSLPNNWERAAETCAQVFVLDEVISSGGEGFIPERVAKIPDDLLESAQLAADSSSEYDQLQLLVGNLVESIRTGDPSGIMDLVAVEGECEQLGFGTNPPQ